MIQRFSENGVNAAKVALFACALAGLSACGGGDSAPAPPIAPPATYTVGGTVGGLNGTLVLQNSGSADLSITTNGAYTFAGSITNGNAYAVTVRTQPGNPSQTCIVVNGAGTVSGNNVTNVAITCTTNTFTVGGTISGLNGSVVLQNNLGNDLTLSASGAFAFSTPIASGGAYSVTVITQPTSPAQTCAVVGGTGAIAAGNVTGVAITCANNTYSVGGTINGLSGTVVLQNNAGNDLSVSSNGSFTFTTPVASGSGYAVTVGTQPASPAQTCVVSSGGGVVGNTNVTSPVVNCAASSTRFARFAYVANEVANTVSAFRVDSTTGAFTAVNGSPYAAGTHPAHVTADPLGKFVYVANFNSSNISAYSINQNSGALTPIAGSPFAAGGTPGWVAAEPSGKFLYATDSGNTANNVLAYAINATTGALTPVSGSPFAAGTNARGVTIDASGRFAYVANQFSQDVSGYTINSTTGALTAVTGSPFTASFGPFGITTDPSGRFAYATNLFSNEVIGYSIDPSSGALTTIAGSPFATGGHPLSVAIDPAGRFAYSANSNFNANNVSAFTINQTTGTLTAVAGSPFAADAGTQAVTVDPSGTFVYAANPDANNVTAYAINQTTGALTPLSSSPIATGNGPTSIVLTGSDTPACTAPIGAGTTHGSISTSQTWTAAASPHILPSDTSIAATVTIEACAVVRIATGATVTINANGSLIAIGAVGRPVTFEALTPGAAWSSIRNLGGTLSLTHAVVTGGGAPLSSSTSLMGALRMQSPSTIGTFHVDDVEIADSLSQGVYINSAVGFDNTSQNLRIHGSVSYPVHVYARVIGSIPTGEYTGNGHDAIAISGSGGAVVSDQTMRNRGVPYHVGSGIDGGRMDVNSQVAGQTAVLTIEPGVTIQFPPGGVFNVDPTTGSGGGAAQGALIAVGGSAPSQKIVFTSDRPSPAAGDWLGVRFGGIVDTRSTMQNVRVEFAGGTSTTGSNSCPYPGPGTGINDAAVRIFGPPLTQFITNSEILSSLNHGIDRGWRADLQPDFLPTNTFTAVGACLETTPRTSAGVCPTNPVCP